MAGWNPEKTEAFRQAFMNFLQYVKINSKETGGSTILGDHIYGAQKRFLDCIFEGLAEDIHDFKILKSRQLGISTVSRALSIFWLGMHPGLQGAMVFDTMDHREEARMELMDIVGNLPEKLRFPKTVRDSRGLFRLDNGSALRFLNAGVKKSRSSGTLGRSSGLNFGHNSEMCSWENSEGLVSYKNALSETYPDRLYIWESTARGFNDWFHMWEEAKSDTLNQRTCFIGWWAKETQMIPRDSPAFRRYGDPPPSPEEKSRIDTVFQRYGFQVTPEQLAWYRRKSNPLFGAKAGEQDELKVDELVLQEQPWDENEAWLQSGSSFFPGTRLTELSLNNASDKYKGYDFITGKDFLNCDFHPVVYTKRVQLKVWEEPEDGGVYVVSADPAYGHDEKNNHSAVQVLRCYADKIVQVAEYANSVITTQPFAWVIASLAGWYKNSMMIVELNGPGEAVLNELKNLKTFVSTGHMRAEAEKRGLRDMFVNVRDFFYARTDSMNAGNCIMWKTTGQLKVTIMERLRDFIGDGTLDLKSFETLEEMKAVVRNGDEIGAEGRNRDDRTYSLAMGIRAWEQNIRRGLSLAGRTKSYEDSIRRMTIKDQIGMFNKHALDSFLKGNASARRLEETMMRRRAWRGR